MEVVADLRHPGLGLLAGALPTLAQTQILRTAGTRIAPWREPSFPSSSTSASPRGAAGAAGAAAVVRLAGVAPVPYVAAVVVASSALGLLVWTRREGFGAQRPARLLPIVGLTISTAIHTFNALVKLRRVVSSTDQLSTVFAALADPTRRTILGQLAEHDSTVTELAAGLPISMPAVSRHLKVLERAELISRTRTGKWRGSHLQAAPLREAAAWIDQYRRFWENSLDRLEAHLADLQAKQPAGRSTPGPFRNTLHEESS